MAAPNFSKFGGPVQPHMQHMPEAATDIYFRYLRPFAYFEPLKLLANYFVKICWKLQPHECEH